MTKLKSITRKSTGQYCVELEELGTGRIMTFDFVVAGQEVEVVQSPPAFIDYISMEYERVLPLMKAVYAFHIAYRLEI
jgi:hypothetical protein